MFKKLFFVVLALVATLSLFVVSASADYVDGEFEPVVGTIDSFSAEVKGAGNVNFNGFTKIDLTLFNNISGVNIGSGTVDIAVFNEGDAYMFYPAMYGQSDSYFRVTKLVWYTSSTTGGQMSAFVLNSSGDENQNDLREGCCLLVRNYPFEIAEGSAPAWEAMQFEAYRVGSEPTDEPAENEDVGSVMSVWSLIMTWIVTALASVQSVFYVNGSLTFIGTLAVVGVSIGIGFLIIGVVQRFLKLRG